MCVRVTSVVREWLKHGTDLGEHTHTHTHKHTHTPHTHMMRYCGQLVMACANGRGCVCVCCLYSDKYTCMYTHEASVTSTVDN